MSELDVINQENAALEARLTQLESQLSAAPIKTEPSGYTLGQFAFDVPAGLARAGAGVADIVSYLNPLRQGNYQPSYTEQIKEAKAGLAESLGVSPDTKVQKAVEFLAPIPGPGKLRVAGDIAAGGLAYIGSELGEKYFPESPGTQLALTLGAPATASLGLKTITSGIPAIGRSAGLIAGSDEALRNAAKAEILAAAGEEGAARLKLAESLTNLGQGTGGIPLTAAEIAQTPSLAKYQTKMAQTQGAGNILVPATEARQTELAAALSRFGIEPQQGDFALALQNAAEEVAKKKVASEGSILQSLGLTEEAATVTKGERGTTLREAISKRLDDATDLADEAWAASSKTTKLNIKDALNKTLEEYGQFGQLAKADISSKAKRVINKARDIVTNKNGIATVGELQDIRSAAGRAMAEASGINPRQVSLMAALRDNIDNFGIKYFYDPSTGMKGGLPGTAATVPDLEALTKLSSAIEATRNLKQTFGTGVIGEITAVRQFKPKLPTSKVIDRAVANPENASEIISKFGKNSVEATELRLEMLARVDKAQNPTDFLGRNKDTLKAIFGDDYAKLNKFVQQKGRGTGLEQFERISDTAIPNKIFADVNQAKRFASTFKDTEMFQYARSKFISTRLIKSGDPLESLAKNKNIAKEYFPDDLDGLEAILKDMQLAKSPQKLAAAATKGQSWTDQLRTTWGAIRSARGLVTTLQKQGPKTGVVVGAVIGAPAGPVGATIGSAVGGVAGYVISRIGDLRDSQLDELAGQILANPSLLELAKAPPTSNNIAALLNRAGQIGYLGTKVSEQESIESENAILEQQLLNLEKKIK